MYQAVVAGAGAVAMNLPAAGNGKLTAMFGQRTGEQKIYPHRGSAGDGSASFPVHPILS